MFMSLWKFRERPPVTLTFVASQEYVELPGDLGEIIAANMTDGLVRSFTFTSFHDLVQRRSTSTGATNHYWLAVTHPAPSNDGEPFPSPRLELYPTPTSTDQITIAYRANWVPLVTDSDIALIPDYAESALIALVRAFALGYEEEGMEMRVGEVESGVMWLRLKEKDGLIQPDYGPLRNSALSMSRQGYQLPWDSTANPS
tara:strand:- start:113 stop:712 length:600 start_codon:yes stop_codon:yes gene_type:complete